MVSGVIANKLVVEGEEDKFALIELMGHHITWPSDKQLAPVGVEQCGGITKLLATGFISGKMKESGVATLGVVLDADDKFAEHWQRIRALSSGMFKNLPLELPHSGLIVQNDDGNRFGVWIMPDNSSHGMLETFLKFLIPKAAEPLRDFAQQAVEKARSVGAPWKDVHADKALVHTWLAWQDPPGESFGRALTKKQLDPHGETAMPFVRWFKELYDL